VHGLAGIVEIPQVYSRERSKADPRDLIDLAYVAGRVVANIPAPDLRVVRPAQWKGQTSCTCTARTALTPEACPHHRRMLAALDDAERFILSCAVGRISQKALVHNVYDGVTLGLVGLRRL
jgi:hypothetical protein